MVAKVTKATLADHLKRLKACPEAREWAKRFKTAAGAWDACERSDWMLWALDALGYDNDRLLRKVACWCARHTPVGRGKTAWDLLTDERSRRAVEVAERFADGDATQEELSAARAAARAAETTWSAGRSASAAREAAWAASAASAAWAAARAAVWSAWPTADAAWSAARAAREAAWSAACSAQTNAIRAIIGNPFRGKGAIKL